MWLYFYIEDKVGVSIIDSIPHYHTENALKKSKNQEMWICFYKEDKVGVCIQHCHTENALNRGKNLDMWLHSYVEDKVGVSVIDSIPNCHTKML